jgi:hypothetical protein
MTLNATSLDWAIDFVVNHSDGDLFPKIIEIEAIQALRSDFVELIEGKDRRQRSLRFRGRRPSPIHRAEG